MSGINPNPVRKPVTAANIIDATAGGRSVIVVSGGSAGNVLTLQADGTYLPAAIPAAPVTSVNGETGTVVLDAAAVGAAATSHTHIIANVTGLQDALDGKQAAGSYATAAQGTKADTALQPASITSGTITAGTGDIDFDALGGLVQFVEAVSTASPNNTVNNVSLTAVGDTTNVSVAIVPKGTGAFLLAVPDGTATGGNVRGANAVDLSTIRTNASQVASGNRSIAIGGYSTASGGLSTAIGDSCTASGGNSTSVGSVNNVSGSHSLAVGTGNTASNGYAIGQSNAASGGNATAIGANNTASGIYSVAEGAYAVASQRGQYARASLFFAAAGDSQEVRFILRRKTTDATPRSLSLNHVDSTLTPLLVTSGKILFANILITGIKSDGSAASTYKRKVAIKNVGGTTSLVGSVETIGTDHEDNASTDVSITADDTNDALDIAVTGIAAETWRWLAVVEGLEIAYGT